MKFDPRFFKFAYGCLILIGGGCFIIAPFMLLYALLMDSSDGAEFVSFFRVVLTGAVSVSLAGIGMTLLEILGETTEVKLPKKSKNPNPYFGFLEDNPLLNQESSVPPREP